MATYAIGDIQGCYEPLRQLLNQVGFSPDRDRLWLVGDLVNRGPHSLEVLRFIKGLGASAITVLGNHDLHLVVHAAGHSRRYPEDTLDAVLAAPDRDELLAWLRSRPLCHAEGGYTLVHAGLLPQWSVADALALSDEVTGALTSPRHGEFIAHMWGNEPDHWQENLKGWDRLRVIVNAMTRMRFCTPEGRMVLGGPGSKGPIDKGPPGCVPWFELPGRRHSETTVVCGHWSALGLRQQPRLLALDSGCLWGGALTAVRLEDRAVFQCQCKAAVAPSGWD